MRSSQCRASTTASVDQRSRARVNHEPGVASTATGGPSPTDGSPNAPCRATAGPHVGPWLASSSAAPAWSPMATRPAERGVVGVTSRATSEPDRTLHGGRRASGRRAPPGGAGGTAAHDLGQQPWVRLAIAKGYLPAWFAGPPARRTSVVETRSTFASIIPNEFQARERQVPARDEQDASESVALDPGVESAHGRDKQVVGVVDDHQPSGSSSGEQPGRCLIGVRADPGRRSPPAGLRSQPETPSVCRRRPTDEEGGRPEPARRPRADPRAGGARRRRGSRGRCPATACPWAAAGSAPPPEGGPERPGPP